MAKTEITKTIEQAICDWHPAQIGDIKINKFRGEHTALEVPAECGTTAGGITWTGERRRDYYVAPEMLKSRWVRMK